MLWKSVTKIMPEVKFRMTVFHGEDFIESFIVDYTEGKNVLKSCSFWSYQVRHISVNHVENLLDITIDIAK